MGSIICFGLFLAHTSPSHDTMYITTSCIFTKSQTNWFFIHLFINSRSLRQKVSFQDLLVVTFNPVEDFLKVSTTSLADWLIHIHSKRFLLSSQINKNIQINNIYVRMCCLSFYDFYEWWPWYSAYRLPLILLAALIMSPLLISLWWESSTARQPDVLGGRGNRKLQLYSLQMSQIFWQESKQVFV